MSSNESRCLCMFLCSKNFFLKSLTYPTKPWYLCCAHKASREHGCARCIWKKWVHFDLRSHVHIFFSFQLWNWQPGAGPTATSWFGIYRLYSHRTSYSPLLGDTFERLELTWQRLLAWAPRQLTTPTICSARRNLFDQGEVAKLLSRR